MPRRSMYKHEDYTSVSIPKETMERIVNVVSKSNLAYVSISEFVRDAVRRRLEELDENTRPT